MVLSPLQLANRVPEGFQDNDHILSSWPVRKEKGNVTNLPVLTTKRGEKKVKTSISLSIINIQSKYKPQQKI